MKITHELSDGTLLDSIEGFIIPRTKATEMIYRTIEGVAIRTADAQKKREEKAWKD
jgi:hypothetical protein